MFDDTPKMLEIQLKTRGGKLAKTTTISIEDADLASLSWCELVIRDRIYARHVYRVEGKQKNLLLHRVILERIIGRELTDNERPDHEDNNPLNNRRSNLRLASIAQNTQNQSKLSTNTSGYKGVYFFKPTGKWRAQIQANWQRKTLGYFDTPEEAHEAYCKAADELHGEFARYE
jgi:hypothetical protein